ncbi:MAG: hypothetical protein AB3N28_13685, partial [Kordiimonas sp.]
NAYYEFKTSVCGEARKLEGEYDSNEFAEDFVRGSGLVAGFTTLVVNTLAAATPGGQPVSAISFAWGSAFVSVGVGAGAIRKWLFRD